MKQYFKPVVSVDNGLAEGVYAASGAGCIDKVIIATDSEEIKKIVLGFELPKVEV